MTGSLKTFILTVGVTFHGLLGSRHAHWTSSGIQNSTRTTDSLQRKETRSLRPAMDLQNPFQAERELDGLSKVLVDIKQPILYAGAAVFLAVAALLGSLVGTKAPGENE